MHACTQAHTVHTLLGYMGVVGRTEDGFMVMPASKQKICRGPPGWCCVGGPWDHRACDHPLILVSYWTLGHLWILGSSHWSLGHGSWAVVVEPWKLDHLSWCQPEPWVYMWYFLGLAEPCVCHMWNIVGLPESLVACGYVSFLHISENGNSPIKLS